MTGGSDQHDSLYPDWHTVDSIFTELLELPEEDRAARLTERCGGDEALRAAVERLLAAERRSQGAFEAASLGLQKLVDDTLVVSEAPVADTADTVPEHLKRLGPYRLLRLVGRGGMSSVWLAERADGAYEKTLAIKVLRQWIDGEDGVRRFVAERQILSSLAHPNIAPLLDGGTTEDGTPWLATEYIEGEPVTSYCEIQKLDTEARLDLFLQVADAVHHAHQKLVVHRDLKPSNILVDAQGRARLLDFGIAKLLDPESPAGPAVPTRAAHRLMTPEYAAPEQVSGGAITTGTDVYQLGVLLHELLAGQRPERAANRTMLKGDLDLIVLKAMQDEPARRYPSAASLAEDIRSHLKGRAISARPDSALDSARRFFRRRPWAAAALLLAVVLVVTLQVSAVRLGQERNAAQREAARVTQVKELLVGLFRQADPMASDTLRGRETTIWDSVQAATARVRAELHDDPILRAEMLGTLAMLHHYSGHMEEGAELLEEVVELYRAQDGTHSRRYAVALAELGRHQMKLDHRTAAMSSIEEALSISQLWPAGAASDKVAVLLDAGDVLRAYGSLHDTEAVFREALALSGGAAPRDLNTWLAAANGLAEVLSELGQHVDAEAIALSSIAAIERELGNAHARLLSPLSILGQLQRALGKPSEAVASLERGLRIIQREYGDRYESTYSMRNNLVLALSAAGEQARALAEMRILVEQRREAMGANHLDVANSMQNLAVMLVLAGQLDEAMGLLDEVRVSYAASLPPDHYRQAFPLMTQAYIRLRQEQPGLAEAPARQASQILEKALPPNHFAVGIAGCLVGEAELRLGQQQDAAARLSAALPVADTGQATTLPYVAHCRSAHAAAIAASASAP